MSNAESYRNILKIESDSIASQAERLDFAAMDKVLDLFCSAKESGHKVILAGCGTAGAAAKRIAHTLSVVEIPAFFLSPADSVHGALGAVQHGDVLVLISNSGNTQEILNYLPVARAKGVATIGVTAHPESSLGQQCTIPLIVQIDREPDKWGLVSSASMLAVTAVFDAIALTSMDYTGFTKQDFLLIHQGGGVGVILSKELGTK